jgi:hypothetical protein
MISFLSTKKKGSFVTFPQLYHTALPLSFPNFFPGQQRSNYRSKCNAEIASRSLVIGSIPSSCLSFQPRLFFAVYTVAVEKHRRGHAHAYTYTRMYEQLPLHIFTHVLAETKRCCLIHESEGLRGRERSSTNCFV